MSPERPPVIYLISGPNGAGKTTFAKEFLPSAHVVEFLNAACLLPDCLLCSPTQWLFVRAG